MSEAFLISCQFESRVTTSSEVSKPDAEGATAKEERGKYRCLFGVQGGGMIVCVVRLMERESLFQGFVLAAESRSLWRRCQDRPKGARGTSRDKIFTSNCNADTCEDRGEFDLQIVCESISSYSASGILARQDRSGHVTWQI